MPQYRIKDLSCSLLYRGFDVEFVFPENHIAVSTMN